MILETERLYFRELTQDDFDAVCRIMQDEEVMRAAYEGTYTDDEVRRWIDYKLAHYQKHGFGLWAVIQKETDELIGQCGLTVQQWNGKDALEIGYLFRRDCWHKGYAVEAATACKNYAFDVLGAERVCSMVRDTNIASQKVAERNGMTVVDRAVKNFRGVDMMFWLYEVRRSIARDSDITIRAMRPSEHDFKLFLKWMTDPDTMRYWEGLNERFTYERVAREYREQVEEQVYQCIIEYGGREIGYCQFCTPDAEYFEVPEKEFYAFADRRDLVYGIDIFIGETEYRDCGIGTRALKLLMKALFDDWNADAIMIDPKTHNARAIACYRKCGFRDLFVVPQREALDGVYYDSLIMGVRKADINNV